MRHQPTLKKRQLLFPGTPQKPSNAWITLLINSTHIFGHYFIATLFASWGALETAVLAQAGNYTEHKEIIINFPLLPSVAFGEDRRAAPNYLPGFHYLSVVSQTLNVIFLLPHCSKINAILDNLILTNEYLNRITLDGGRHSDKCKPPTVLSNRYMSVLLPYISYLLPGLPLLPWISWCPVRKLNYPCSWYHNIVWIFVEFQYH